jgi:threonine dehydratase
MLTEAQLAAAVDLVGRHVAPTPQFAWGLLADEVGCEVWVKHENCTPTGAFKVRGGVVHVQRLLEAQPTVPGLISATRGNHGQSIAFAGRTHGVPVTIVVPEGNSIEKNAAMVGFGAELVVHGDDFDAARDHAGELAAARGLRMVPSFHPDLVAGVATYAKELFDAAGPLDAVYVPVGLGSGICGVIAVRDLLGLPTEVIGVVSERAPGYALSFAAGTVVATDSARTIIDGVAVRTPDPDALDVIRRGASRIVQISDDDASAAVRLMFRTTHHLACPSGAAALAGLWNERERWSGGRVAVILTSGNVDTAVAAQILAGTTPEP